MRAYARLDRQALQGLNQRSGAAPLLAKSEVGLAGGARLGLVRAHVRKWPV